MSIEFDAERWLKNLPVFFAVERWLFQKYEARFSAAILPGGRFLVMDDADQDHISIDVFKDLETLMESSIYPADVAKKIEKYYNAWEDPIDPATGKPVGGPEFAKKMRRKR